MEYVSYPKTSMGTRWRPDVQVAASLRGWQPRPMGAPAPAFRPVSPQRAVLGQAPPAALADTTLSVGTSLGAAVAGFGLAFLGGQQTTWRWIGGIAGSIGVLRLLHDISKSA